MEQSLLIPESISEKNIVPTHEKHGAKKFQRSYFDVLGICCSSEIAIVQRILSNLEGVKDAQVIITTKTVIVRHDDLLISPQEIAKALNEARLEASVRVQSAKIYPKRWPSPYAIASGILLLLSFLKFFYQPFQWLALGAVALGIFPILLRSLMAIRFFTLGDVNILVLIAAAGSIALNDYLEAGTIVFLFTIAQWLESRASHKATAAMSSLVNLVPQRAVLAETGEEVNVDEVMVNTLLAVKDGEIIPIDGIVVEGICEVDEKTLTGESFPVPKQKDSNVWAGTVNLNGYISIRTTALSEDCAVARMTKLVEEAQNKKSRTERYIDKCAKYYIPAVIVISASLALVPTVLGVHNKRQWYHLALVVLVCACPCALVLSTPVAVFCALTKAATSGVFIKGADYLETLAKVKIMAFDKTGTITRAEFEVTEFKCLSEDISLSTLLYWISSIESKSSHPLAAALVAFAKSHSVEPKPDKVVQFQNFPGEGLYGKIDGKEIYVGGMKIASRAGCTSVSNIEGTIAEGKSTGYLFLGSIPVGIFYLTDMCRTGAKEALEELKSMGIQTAMLTGDCYAAAKHAQDQLGGALEVVYAELLPEDKARIIKDFQMVAYTAMIGDGLNDAAALATADIGIAMGISGSALATETGNVILLSNNIQGIPKVAHIARGLKQKVIENIILSISTKLAILALAIAGHPLVWAAVLVDAGTCLLVILNSMLLLREKKEHGTKSCNSSATSVASKSRENCTRNGLRQTLLHKPCCNDTKQPRNCQQQTCSSKNCAPTYQPSTLSSTSCGNGSNLNSSAKHSCCGHDNQLDEPKTSSRGSCKNVSQVCHNSSKSCGESIINEEVPAKNSSTSSSNVYSKLVSHEQSQLNCCLNHTGKRPSTDEEIGDLVRSCCQSNQAKTANSGCRNHAKEHDAPHHTTTNILEGDNQESCRAGKSCMNFKQRQVGACCKSFRKECCKNYGQSGADSGGGLSEIVIE